MGLLFLVSNLIARWRADTQLKWRERYGSSPRILIGSDESRDMLIAHEGGVFNQKNIWRIYNFFKNVLKVDFWQKIDLKNFEKVQTTKQYKQEKTVVLCAPISSGLVLPLFWIIFLNLVVLTAYILRLFPCLSEWMDLYSLKSNPNNMSSFLMNSGSYMDPKFLTGEDYAQANYAHHSPGDYYSHQVYLPANNLTLVF